MIKLRSASLSESSSEKPHRTADHHQASSLAPAAQHQQDQHAKKTLTLSSIIQAIGTISLAPTGYVHEAFHHVFRSNADAHEAWPALESRLLQRRRLSLDESDFANAHLTILGWVRHGPTLLAAIEEAGELLAVSVDEVKRLVGREFFQLVYDNYGATLRFLGQSLEDLLASLDIFRDQLPLAFGQVAKNGPSMQVDAEGGERLRLLYDGGQSELLRDGRFLVGVLEAAGKGLSAFNMPLAGASLKGGRGHAPWMWFAPPPPGGGGGPDGRVREMFAPTLEIFRIAPPPSRKKPATPLAPRTWGLWQNGTLV